MSPTVFRQAGFRFYFFSREEPRVHVHVQHESGEAKVWLDPRIEVARNWGMTKKRLAEVLRIVHEHEQEILQAWEEHFGA